MAANGGFGTLNEVLRALVHPRRRLILYYLQAQQQVTVDELAKQIAAWELERSPADVPATTSEQVMAELVHTHLPQLADLHFIEYDDRSLTVRYTDPPVLLDKVLEVLAQLEREIDG